VGRAEGYDGRVNVIATLRQIIDRRSPVTGRVAVLRLFGPISGGPRSAEWIETVARARRSRRIPAVVLDIDSPGGSAPASDYLYLALARLAAEKPLVAHVRGVGASGAYLAALAARSIVVAPNAVVGSIGVISAAPRVATLLERIGVRIQETKAGSLKGQGAPWRDDTPEEEAKERELVDAYYDAFVGRVAEGRHLAPERARELATGEVWLGSRSVELGLADEVGDLERAIEIAAAAAGVPARGVAVHARRPFLERLVDRFATRAVGSLTDAVETELWRRDPRL
jgi:protease IV